MLSLSQYICTPLESCKDDDRHCLATILAHSRSCEDKGPTSICCLANWAVHENTNGVRSFVPFYFQLIFDVTNSKYRLGSICHLTLNVCHCRRCSLQDWQAWICLSDSGTSTWWVSSFRIWFIVFNYIWANFSVFFLPKSKNFIFNNFHFNVK